MRQWDWHRDTSQVLCAFTKICHIQIQMLLQCLRRLASPVVVDFFNIADTGMQMSWKVLQFMPQSLQVVVHVCGCNQRQIIQSINLAGGTAAHLSGLCEFLMHAVGVGEITYSGPVAIVFVMRVGGLCDDM